MMKTMYLFFIVLLTLGCNKSTLKSVEGVYKSEKGDVHQLWILEDGYSSRIDFKDNEYLSTQGGTFVLEGNKLKIHKEFDDLDPEKIGETEAHIVEFTGMDFIDEDGIKWVKQPTKKQDLDGLWEITGRMQEGEVVTIHQTGTRKTLKLLKDGYFQWMAIDPGTKKFFGTGGGRYTFEDGKYTEHIEFFSRDNSRVGAALEFDGELKDGDWHHSGKSSKGDPIYEVWSNP